VFASADVHGLVGHRDKSLADPLQAWAYTTAGSTGPRGQEGYAHPHVRSGHPRRLAVRENFRFDPETDIIGSSRHVSTCQYATFKVDREWREPGAVISIGHANDTTGFDIEFNVLLPMICYQFPIRNRRHWSANFTPTGTIICASAIRRAWRTCLAILWPRCSFFDGPAICSPR